MNYPQRNPTIEVNEAGVQRYPTSTTEVCLLPYKVWRCHAQCSFLSTSGGHSGLSFPPES